MPDLPSLFETARDELRAIGISLTMQPGTYRVNFAHGADATAYLTDDLADAIEHGRAMAASASAPAAAAPTGKPPRRRRRPPPRSAKARRRAAIKAHNRRLRSRALRLQIADRIDDATK